MKKIYGDLKDKYVAKVVLYGHSDNFLYVDDKHTTPITHDELLDLALKGLVVVSMNNAYYHPYSVKDNTTDVSVFIATTISSSASESKELKSKDAGED